MKSVAWGTTTPPLDTLYHAVAVEASDAVLVTADERYDAKARPVGRIERLAERAP